MNIWNTYIVIQGKNIVDQLISREIKYLKQNNLCFLGLVFYKKWDLDEDIRNIIPSDWLIEKCFRIFD